MSQERNEKEEHFHKQIKENGMRQDISASSGRKSELCPSSGSRWSSASASSHQEASTGEKARPFLLRKNKKDELLLNQMKHLVVQKHIFPLECVKLQYALRCFRELKLMENMPHEDISAQTKETSSLSCPAERRRLPEVSDTEDS